MVVRRTLTSAENSPKAETSLLGRLQRSTLAMSVLLLMH